MTNMFTRIKLIFLGLFVLAVGVIWGYHFFYVWPGQRCEAAGRWWAMKERACGVPVRISTLTGRADAPPTPTPVPAKSASARPALPQPAPKAP